MGGAGAHWLGSLQHLKSRIQTHEFESSSGGVREGDSDTLRFVFAGIFLFEKRAKRCQEHKRTANQSVGLIGQALHMRLGVFSGASFARLSQFRK